MQEIIPMSKLSYHKQPIEVVDLFCGIGGLSYGMKCNGFIIKAGYDIDATCKFAFEYNNGSVFNHENIVNVNGEKIKAHYDKGAIKILAGCAPCQPFSSYAFKNKQKDPSKYDLLYEFGRLVSEVNPDIVTMENVPAILSFKLKNVLQDFVLQLEKLGFNVTVNVVFCPDYGVPQTRKRLVLLASRFGKIELISPTCSPSEYKTVRQTIGNLPHIKAGQICPTDPLHRSAGLTPLNLERIRHTPMGGGWKDWPVNLRLKCHQVESGKSYGSVYGRMKWDAPAPTMTTQCTGLGNGRFGHPEQDRAISAREAALLQTFPQSYRFFENEKDISLGTASRYIGNAVPPRLGEVVAESIIKHLKEISDGKKNN